MDQRRKCKQTSLAWDFFEKDGSNVKCKICKNFYKFNSTTSNMTMHLEKAHAVQYTQASADRAREDESVNVVPQASTSRPVTLVQPTVEETIERNRPYDSTSNRKKDIDEAFLYMVVGDLQPFSVVEDRWFKNLMRVMDPRYQLPSRRSLTRTMIPQLYEREKERVRALLRATEYVSLTTDIWTSRKTQSYITVTAHGITLDWKLHSWVLETVRMTEAHTALNIKEELTKITQDWGISDKVFAIVTDNASNMVSAVKLFKAEHVPCFAHTLNLVVMDTLKVMTHLAELRKKIRNIVGHFHSSVKSSEVLENAQRTQGACSSTPLKLIIEVDTRWNSTYYMLERYLQLHTQVTTALCVVQRHNMCVTAEELESIREATTALQPFEMATTEISGEKFTTLSLVIPMVQMLHELLKESSSTNKVAAELQRQLEKRFPCPESCHLWAAATYLDPRFKRHGFSDESNVTEIEDKLSNKLTPQTTKEPEHQEQELSAAAQTSTSGLWAKFDAHVKNFLTTSTKPTIRSHLELKHFKEEDPVARHDDPLDWWQARSQMMPHMSKLARGYLSCPATSVPSERLFSKAGELVCQRRACVGEKNINMVLFLNKNLGQ